MHLIERYGFFIIVPTIFVAVGVGAFINIVWGLLTGGPRALNEPGMPYLYDRLYYLQFIFTMTGWTVGLLSFVAESNGKAAGSGFIVGWGICAIGMGSLFALRGNMILRGARYLSANGFWAWRFFHRMQVKQFERQAAFMRKLIGGIFIVAGIVVLAFNFADIPGAFHGAVAGAQALLDIVTAP